MEASKQLVRAIRGSLAMAILGIALASCAVQGQPRTATIWISVQFKDQAAQVIESRYTPEDASFQLGAIPGAIWGNFGKTLETYKIGKRVGFDFNVDAFVNAFSVTAATITAKASKAGLMIDPIDARFSRASTLVDYRGAGRVALFIGFVDSRKGQPLTLMYFDRPCHVSGTLVDNSKKQVHYDVLVKNPGLVWLAQSKEVGSESFVELADPSVSPILVIKRLP